MSTAPTTSRESPQIVIRLGRVSDRGFVVDSWRQSYWRAPAVLGMSRDAFMSEQKTRINRWMGTPGAVLVVAHPVDDDDVIVGWAAAERAAGSTVAPEVLHYVFVRRELRGEGIARALVGAMHMQAPVTFTHWSRWLRAAPKETQFNPLWRAQ